MNVVNKTVILLDNSSRHIQVFTMNNAQSRSSYKSKSTTRDAQKGKVAKNEVKSQNSEVSFILVCYAK